MNDFKPFCLADNMARSANLGEFPNREGGNPGWKRRRMKKPGRAKRDRVVYSGRLALSDATGRNYFALATIDSNGL
jgi:hypothetical protein